MLEDSPEAFMARWQRYAAEVELYPRTEGSPLLECRAGDVLLQLFERTGPYLSAPGAKRAIIHPLTAALERLGPEGFEPRMSATGISRMEAQGRVVALEGRLVVVDAGAPLVVGLVEGAPGGVAVGDVVRFESEAPIHGFVLADRATYTPHPRQGRADELP